VIDSPKQPLETGEIIIARVSQSDLDLIIGVGSQGLRFSAGHLKLMGAIQ
jgi:hypothetical protein